MHKYNIIIFFRKIIRYKSTFLINITGLSTGLACVLLITLWVVDELSVDKFHANDTHLFQVIEYSETDGTILTNPRTAGLVAENLILEFPEIQYTTSVRETNEINIAFENTFLKAIGLYASEEFFEVFSFPLLEGDKSTILRNKNSIVLSKDLAVKLFGNFNAVVGKTILLEQKMPFVVTGVSENVPSNSSIQFDFVMSYEFFKDINPNTLNWSYNTTNAYLVLNNGVDPEKFNAKIKDFIRTKSNDTHRTLSTRLYSNSYLYSNYENGVQKGGRIDYVKLIALIAIKPLFFVLRPSWTHIVMAKITKGKEQLALNNLKDFYQRYKPGKQLDYKFLDDTYKSQYISEQRISTMSRYFAGLAILISCLGLLGLSTFNAERRRKEISIRKIHGQTTSQITVMLSSEFTKLVLVSIIIALPVAYFVTNSWLSGFAYKVPLQIWYYLGAGIVALLIAILTVASQAIHSANKNPVDGLRYE